MNEPGSQKTWVLSTVSEAGHRPECECKSQDRIRKKNSWPWPQPHAGHFTAPPCSILPTRLGGRCLTARETEAQGRYTTCPRTRNQYAAQLDSTPGSFTRSPCSRVLSHGTFLAMGHTEAPGIHFLLCDGARSHWAVRCGSWQCTWRGPAGSRLHAYGLSLTAD